MVTLRDGRRLAYTEYGDPEGRPLFAFHGLPGSRYQRHPDESIALAAGVRAIHLERPGFGRSDPMSGRTIADWPADVAATADLLGIDRFAVAGVSGGGPYAVACAALLGERLTRVAVVSGVGPPGSMRDGPVTFILRLGLALGPLAPWLIQGAVAAIAKFAIARPHRFLDVVASHMGPPDRPILARPEMRAMLAEDLREAFRQGTRPVVEDLALVARPWRLPLTTTRTRTAFWHGDGDRLIPVSASRYLADAIPGALLHVCPAEGHFMVLDHWPEILKWVAG
jgi:pimeloyl-ACP methyl ester carboxylesterase